MFSLTPTFVDSLEEQQQEIIALAKPRVTKMDWKWKVGFLLIPITFGLLVLSLNNAISTNRVGHAMENAQELLMLFFLLSLLIILITLMLRELKFREIVRGGECVIGKIISQRRVKNGRGSRSEIVYSFPVGRGKPMMGRAKDETRSYTENMPVLVFYDPEDISRNVAYCSTGWRIRSEKGWWLEP